MTTATLDSISANTVSDQWLSTKETEAFLNVNRRVLYQQKKIDRFKSEVHYRILDPEAERPTYQWNAGAIESSMHDAIDALLMTV